LQLLDEKSMLAALTEFIDKDEIYALSTMVEAQIEQSQVGRVKTNGVVETLCFGA
jgi:hypothetical protein